ncbi:outer membrane protein [Novosphingobium taihuense]|uniref:Outer membrane immunogenic protein n=1 Tax=Novosphingobium taihuense TaxID=260085 RepID=A0A7W7EUI5_9SPHN|nr:outer membrane beta-barrel protein [Novosphingobium taihuense]MBB4612365.1 outer membrane immunogenic protein [Novosphingobium taihuense]TWH88282.1 outer membrane immunogenic protein [Novosphingobium taihuense]
MTSKTIFAWPLAATLAFVAAPSMAQDSGDDMSTTTTTSGTTTDGFNRDRHFDGVYIQGAGGIGMLGKNNGTFGFDTNRDGNYNDNVNTVLGANAFSPGFANCGALTSTRGGGCSTDKTGAEYAVRIGLDKRMGDVVIGGLIEGSRNESVDRSTAYSTSPAFYRIDRKLDYAISARARLGFTPGGGALFYGTGGVSYGKIKHDFTTSNTSNAFAEDRDDKMVWGWQAGGGTEIMLSDHLSLGLEYLYSRYNDNKYSVRVSQGTAPDTNPFLLNGGGTNFRLQDKHFDTHAVRAVVGLRF